MHWLRTVTLAASMTVAASASAFAGPIDLKPIYGGFNIVGLFRAENAAGTSNARFSSARSIDFLNVNAPPSNPPAGLDNGLGGNGSVLFLNGTKSFSGISFMSVGTIKDFTFTYTASPVAKPVMNFITIGAFSFDLSTLRMQNTGNALIVLEGTGTLKRPHREPTPAELVFTFQSGARSPSDTNAGRTLGTFSWSGSVSSVAPDPIPAPEPATLALFGTALIGLGLTRRVRRRVRDKI